MTDPTTNSTSPTKESRRTYASYSAATTTTNNNNNNNNKGDTPSTAATNESSPLNNKDLSVMEMTSDLFQSQEDTGRKSGIDWSFGDSDGEDNDNSNSNNTSAEDPAEEDDDNANNNKNNACQKETELPATPPSVTKPAISDSDTASMSGEEEPETPEKNEKTGAKEAVETPSAAAEPEHEPEPEPEHESMEIENESIMEKEIPNDDASETVQPEQSQVSSEDKDVTNALETKESNPEQEGGDSGDSDDDATVALDMEEDDDEAAKPKSSLFDIDLSDQEEEDNPINEAENAASDDEEESSKPTKRGRTKRKPKKKLPVQKTIPEDSDSEQEFDDAMETSPAASTAAAAAAAAAEKEQPTEDAMETSPTPAETEQNVADGDEADVEDNGRRRSRRTPKKRNLEFVPPEPSPRKTSTKSKKDKQQEKKKKKTKGGQEPEPEQDQLLTSTDYLFLQADKASVTVKDILKALEAEFECKLSKATRKFVRGHLVALMSGEVQPSISLDDNDGKPTNDDEEEENVGEEEEEEEPEEEDQISEQGDVESEFEADDESDGDDDFGAKSKRKSKKKSSSPKSKVQKKKKKDARSKPKRPNQRKAAKAARLVEAMRLRKKRMEELRVRNEEMQLNQTKEDQARAEKIAAKLDTNTDELRIQRLEDRLDLLGKLDQKRIVVLLEEDTLLSDLKKDTTEEEKENGKTEIKEEGDASKPEEADSEEEDSEEESSDEEDLVIVGATRRIKPMAPLSAHVKATAIEVLNRLKSPDRKQQLNKHRQQQQQQQQQLAPANNMRARSALRHSLKQKQRSMSNTWLARELGYKTEQEHLQDCEEAANKKRGLTILREQQRIQANGRKQLRERLMVQDAPVADDDDEEKEANLEETAAAKPEEEDEEMQMAKEIEKEQAAKVASEEEPESTESQALKNTESQEPAKSPVEVTEESTSSKHDSEETSIPSTPEEDDDAEDFSPDFSQEEEAQPLESRIPELPDTETQAETPRLETQLLPPVATSTAEDKREETQRLETQVPPSVQKMPPPAAVVRKVTTEAGGELSQLSDGVDEESPKQDAVPPTEAAEKSTDSKPEAVAEGKDSEDGEDDGELEFVEEKQEKSKQDRNSAWKMMLQKEAEKYKKQKKRKGGNGLVEQEAEEEEEEEVAGLEDFGFSVKKKKNGEDEDEDPDSLKMDEDDLEHIVDDVSDGEGDEEAGRIARKKQEQREEKERHKDMIRRMREGYDGRRGGIAGSGVGARGMHRFDQLVAADNREDAKRLGLLNEDELDSDDENNENKKGDADVEDDEAALLDEMLKDRFLHRSNVELENFSDDDDADDEKESEETKGMSKEEAAEAIEERTQERLAKRFAKRARMCRLEEQYAESQEFSQQRMIDEDETMKKELSQMKNGLIRNRSTSSRSSFSSNSNLGSTTLKRQRSTSSNLSTSLLRQTSTSSNFSSALKRQKSTGNTFGGAFLEKSGSLSVALRGSRSHTKRRTSFLGGDKAGDTKDQYASVSKNVALSHVVFKADSSRSGSGSNGKRKLGSAGGSFFSRATGKNQ